MNDQPKGVKIVAIAGSVRPDNYSGKALRLVIDEIKKKPDVSLEVIDPLEMQFPALGKEDKSKAEQIQKIVSSATGIILSTPEYHGSYSAVIKLIIENLGFPSVLSGKPIALLGVAAGQIGAIKALEHLRSVCSHVGAIVLPGPVSVAGVTKIFDENGKCLDEKVELRIRNLGIQLIDYINQNICPRKALEELVREN